MTCCEEITTTKSIDNVLNSGCYTMQVIINKIINKVICNCSESNNDITVSNCIHFVSSESSLGSQGYLELSSDSLDGNTL